MGQAEAREDEASERAEESAALLRPAKAGDTLAFARLMELYERRVFLTARRLLGFPDEAEDATQEVFLRFYRRLRHLDDARDCLPWLYRVTVNVCRSMARRRSRESRGLQAYASAFAQATDPGPETEREAQSRSLARALTHLPEKERAAIVLRDIEGLKTREVARILRSSEGTVRSQVSAARLKLRRLLGQGGQG